LQGPDGAKLRPFSVADGHFPPPALLVRFAFADGQYSAFRDKLYILYIQAHKLTSAKGGEKAYKYEGFVS
jgi:hypothetical protein